MKKPRLGQNYLIDDNIAHKIVCHAGISNDQHVLEIGPGKGILTNLLLEKTKSLTAFVRGSKYIFPDSNIESDSSIEPGAVAGFELVIPSNFGTFIGYSYSLDWEQYDE